MTKDERLRAVLCNLKNMSWCVHLYYKLEFEDIIYLNEVLEYEIAHNTSIVVFRIINNIHNDFIKLIAEENKFGYNIDPVAAAVIIGVIERYFQRT